VGRSRPSSPVSELQPRLESWQVAAVGIAHELGDGDFTKAEGAPWNGIIDVLAFLPVPLVWWAL
jgi:hypothetical protein